MYFDAVVQEARTIHDCASWSNSTLPLLMKDTVSLDSSIVIATVLACHASGMQ